ncbi:hypothetical protein AO073_01615 [Pseudomonas syringae ICMP 11293]|uniref:hypothetical protein n=1 Tax=Pseudomonas syringae TaxID=317 RepID=UPI00072FFB62|nr:hypothetical protein [Pseudomonas syringae]KTB91598.1 hypothetical protein AO073_01615 [Pseudomonas syringae ICMP 11293]
MAQLKKPISIKDFLGKNLSKNKFTKHFVDILGYIPADDIDDPINGMQSDFDPTQTWASLGNAGVTSFTDAEKPLSEKEELKLKEKLQAFADEYGLKLNYNPLYNDYTLKDKDGQEIYGVKKNGNFKYTGYDLDSPQYKQMIVISAGQFRGNEKLIYPYVAENNPKINDSMQEKTMRLMISTMIEEGVGVERIRIKSKKWKHLIDEYKSAEELKNEEFLNGNTGISNKANGSQAPPTDVENQTPNEPQSDNKEVSNESVEADKAVQNAPVEAGKTVESVPVEAVEETPAEKAYSVKEETIRLGKNLAWALKEADGNIEMLATKNKQFHKDNFEISFTKNAEMVHISNVRPNEDGNIVTVNVKTNNITGANVYIGKMDEYERVIDAQKANGFLKHKLTEAVNFTKGDYEAFREKMDADNKLSWGFTKDEKHLFASLEKEDGTIEFGKVSLAKGYGEKLIESKKGLLSEADLQKDKNDGYADNFEDALFSTDFNSVKPSDAKADSKSSSKFKI